MLEKVMIMMALLSVRCLEAEGYGDGIFNKLCDVVRKTRALYKLHVYNSTGKKSLEQAIYGTKTASLFKDDGSAEISGKCGGLKMRSYLCTYHSWGSMLYWKGGCLAESLLGTIMCDCTPSYSKSSMINFCGVDTKNYDGKAWLGKWLNSEEQKELIEKVWKEVKEKCLEDGEYDLQGEEKLKDSKNFPDAPTKKLKPKTAVNILYLGENGWDGYSGTNGDSVCASYKGDMADTKRVNIPWMHKIVKTLEDLKQKLETEARTLEVTASSHSTPEASGTLPESREILKNEEAAVQIKHSADETNEYMGLLETEVEKSGKTESSLVDSTASENGEDRTTPHHPLKESQHIATNSNKDGFCMTRKFSFL